MKSLYAGEHIPFMVLLFLFDLSLSVMCFLILALLREVGSCCFEYRKKSQNKIQMFNLTSYRCQMMVVYCGMLPYVMIFALGIQFYCR